MIPSTLTRQAFERAGLTDMDPLLLGLQELIEKATLEIVESDSPAREKPALLDRLWDQICAELNDLGHGLYCHDYDGDVSFEAYAQTWGPNYMEPVQNGLRIEFRARSVDVSWVIRRRRA